MSDIAIKTKNLSVRYGRTTALDDVSLQVEAGSLFALLGRNGAGKSSLIRCLLGHLPASTGSVSVFGLDPWVHRAQLMKRLGVVPEKPDLPTGMPVGAVGRFCASVDGGFSLPDFKARLERHGVSGNARIDQLSRGQQTQVQLAVAMANRPQLLVLDDPTLGLDAVARKEVFAELIDELAERELTVLVATHDLAGIERLATHVGFLRKGQLTLSEPLDGLKRRLRRVSMPVGAVQDVGSSRTVRCRRTALGLERIVEVDEADPAASAVGEPMTLEEIFVALTDEPTGEEECGPGAGAVAARSVVGSTRAGSAA